MNNYIVPKWIQEFEVDAYPFPIESIKLEKFNNDWTLFFYSNQDTTGGLIVNNSTGVKIGELFTYVKERQIPIVLNEQPIFL